MPTSGREATIPDAHELICRYTLDWTAAISSDGSTAVTYLASATWRRSPRQSRVVAAREDGPHRSPAGAEAQTARRSVQAAFLKLLAASAGAGIVAPNPAKRVRHRLRRLPELGDTAEGGTPRHLALMLLGKGMPLG
jgi:hypothetical protein